MNHTKYYKGIDIFRVVAAFLIIAIHTSPLSSYSQTGDFILTRIISRVAVPFFLMTSGFFLISKYNYNDDKLRAFVKKTVLIYAVSIVIYIPINIYNGYFAMDHLLPNIIKDLLFDGTLYHLWYLPASVIGAMLAWLFVKKTGFKKALMITSAFYVIGLFGDSYYGISEKLPLLKAFYGYVFQVSDYTRNGVFFAPVFFVLGGMIADKPFRTSLKKSLIGLLVSVLLLFSEGLLLHRLGVQRHDSMYILLLPCMYFLFHTLTFWKGHQRAFLRTATLVIYIIHPMMIVVIRLFAKLLGLQTLLVENSVVHYLAVSITSTSFAVLSVLALYKFKNSNTKTKASVINKERAWIEIDLNNLSHNVKVLRKAMPEGCELMAVVKADAYGHGSFEVSAAVSRMGVKLFAVAAIDEGIALRRYGIEGEILILGYTNPARARELYKYKLTQTLISLEYAGFLANQGYKIKTHIKVDTGMHRLGFAASDVDDILKVLRDKKIYVCGIFTHLCVSDSLKAEDVSFTKMQISSFYQLLERIRMAGIEPPPIHIQSSYGLLNYPELKCDYVRAGIALYGVLSSPHDNPHLHLDLRPVLSLKSQVILMRAVRSGESVGYGRSFVAKRDSLIAILSIGYADGVPRNLSSENGEVLIGGYTVPIVGRICMDQLAVDVTDIRDVAVGMTATLIGTDNSNSLSAAMVADKAGTITNELLSRMGTRIIRSIT